MKKRIKHEVSKASNWGLAILGGLGGLVSYLPEIRAFVPPAAFPAVAVAAFIARQVQRSWDANK